MKTSQFNPGDRVMYVGDIHECLWAMPLTVHSKNGQYLNCRFPEADRPGGFGLTNWLYPQDLILEEVAA
jgi:hypothetical protein